MHAMTALMLLQNVVFAELWLAAATVRVCL
jgi:hypothetical protein